MPIISYLAYPAPGKRNVLALALSAIPRCETIAATNMDVLVLVTETSDEEAERRLQEQLSRISSLHVLVMVSAFADAGSA